MDSVVRTHHLMAGVAVASAGILALSPVTPMPYAAQAQLQPPLHTASIRLMANPLDAYVALVVNSFGSVGGLAHQAVTPSLLPIARAVLGNQLGYAQAIGGGILVSGGNLVDQLFNELPAATVQAIGEFLTGNPLASAETVVNAFRSLLLQTLGPIVGPTTAVLSTIAFRTEQAIEAALSPAVVTTLVLGLTSPAYATVLAAGQAAQNVVDAAEQRDFLGVVGQTIAAPAVVVDGLLNGITVGSTTYGGLLSPLAPDFQSTGPIGALLFARNQIAFAVSPDSASSTLRATPTPVSQLRRVLQHRESSAITSLSVTRDDTDHVAANPFRRPARLLTLDRSPAVTAGNSTSTAHRPLQNGPKPVKQAVKGLRNAAKNLRTNTK